MDDQVATSNSVDDEAALRGLYQEPTELAILKQLDRLDGHCRNFLAHSPFAVIGSTRAGRGTDVSPRGDAPGFVRVLDDHTIAIPDRPGNNRLDTMSNIVPRHRRDAAHQRHRAAFAGAGAACGGRRQWA